MDWAALAAFVSALVGVGALALKWRHDRDAEARGRAEDARNRDHDRQERRRDLQAFVAAQTEQLLKGYEGVFDEYRRQASALIEQLRDLTTERDELLARVDSLEREVQRVPELERQIETLRGRIAELEQGRVT
jgi:predicted RNase H-like nuclease (RuvC/YqgF family)